MPQSDFGLLLTPPCTQHRHHAGLRKAEPAPAEQHTHMIGTAVSRPADGAEHGHVSSRPGITGADLATCLQRLRWPVLASRTQSAGAAQSAVILVRVPRAGRSLQSFLCLLGPVSVHAPGTPERPAGRAAPGLCTDRRRDQAGGCSRGGCRSCPGPPAAASAGRHPQRHAQARAPVHAARARCALSPGMVRGERAALLASPRRAACTCRCCSLGCCSPAWLRGLPAG